MHAILITRENLSKIVERFPEDPAAHSAMDIYLGSKTQWYFISGYVDQQGHFEEWTMLPDYVMGRFEYDPNKIQTDWDQIVRK